MQIAIDGPAGAGKSTIAKLVAKQKSFIYIDTGAMYRAMGLYMKGKGVDYKDENEVSKHCKEPLIDLKDENGFLKVLLEGEDVSERIRTQEVGEIASVISAYPKVREQLVALQQRMASNCDVVMDGRDIGSNVLPFAELKIYLDASAQVRAERRAKELREKGEPADIDRIRSEIEQRDERDKNRALNPLKKAEDAIEIDTSDMSIAEVASAIEREYSKLCR